ncbi:MAG: hypothetical protein WC834_01810 [Eubacteriales bacterium]
MRDRTLVMLALLFLTLTVAAGVNKSLEAYNGMLGRPVAAGLKETYYLQKPRVLDGAKTLAEYGRNTGEAIFLRNYGVISREAGRLKAEIGPEVKAKLVSWHERLRQILIIGGQKLVDGKKRFIQ